jgi:MFS transporter, DHA2 family, multidrug resistance protein
MTAAMTTEQEREVPAGAGFRLWTITAACTLLPVMVTLDATAINVAQRTLVHAFSSTPAITAWTVTGYALALAAAIPLTGWAASRLGTKVLALGAVVVFAWASLLCSQAPNIAALVAFRALQGLGGGILIPLQLIILARAAGPRRSGRVLTIGMVPVVIAPICGPILGGWLIDSFGWQSIFLINIPIGLLALVVAGLVLPEDDPSPAEPLDHAPRRADRALIDLRLLKNRDVAAANAIRFLFVIAFSGCCLLFPACFQQVLSKTPLESGLLLIPQTLAAAAVLPIATRLLERLGARGMVLVGTALTAIGIGVFVSGMGRHHGDLTVLLAGLVMFGAGSGCVMAPVSRPDTTRETAYGSALFNVNHHVATAIGAAFMSVILTGMLGGGAVERVANGLSGAYAGVFVVAMIVVAAIVVPASFLPTRPAPHAESIRVDMRRA